MKGRRGGSMLDAGAFTLVELLVALAIGALLLTALVGLMRSTRHSAVAVTTDGDDALALQLAAELLREELRLAGSQPWPRVKVPDVEDLDSWLIAPLRIEPVETGHRLALRYVDHRLSGPPLARDLLFEVSSDGSGDSQLYRRVVGAARQPLVAGVRSLTVVATVDIGGTWRVWGQPGSVGRKVAAVVLELTAGRLVRRLVLELPNRPELTP